MEDFFVNWAVPLSMWLVIIGAALAIIGSVINSFNNPKAMIKSVIGIVALAVVFFIGYATATGETTPMYTEMGLAETGSKMIGGVLNMMYILIFIAIVGIIADSILKFFR